MAAAPQPVLLPHPPAFEPNPDDPGQQAFMDLKNKHRLLFGGEIWPTVKRMQAIDDLVAGILPARSVNVLVGDSGVGKTPLAYQLALCVAAGLPFLGAETRQRKVLVLDYENSLWDTHRILHQQRLFLGLARYPSPWFIFWPVNNGTPQEEIMDAVRILAPDLLIIDSLRSFCPTLEGRNASAAEEIKKLRELAKVSCTATLLVHHVRRPATRQARSFEQNDALEWLANSAGARAVINQSDVRLAVAPSQKHEGALVLRGYLRMRGEVGPYMIRRRYDDDGQPLGYERFEARPSMYPEQEAFFDSLPFAFSYGEARQLYSKGDDTTNAFLHKLMQAGLLRKVARGQYQKCENAGETGGTQSTQ